MMPPACEVCDRALSNTPASEFELVHFKLTEEQQQAERERKRPGFTGHPPGALWFCREHAEAAKKLAHLTAGEALRQLRAT